MKRTILRLTAIILTLAAVFALSGCFGEEKEPLPDIVLEDLYGTWTRVSSSVSEKYTFSENMKYSRVRDGDYSNGTYSVSGSILTLKPDAVENPTDHTVEIKGDTMIWGYSSIKSEFKRQK